MSSTRRVRLGLLGIALAAAAVAHLRYHGGILPRRWLG